MLYSTLANFLDPDQAMLISLLITSIFISYTMSLLRNKYLILAVSIISTFIFQSCMYPEQKYILWTQQQIVYLLLKFGPRKYIGKIILIQTFLSLGIVQIRRMYISYGVNGVDITSVLMMQTFLYIGLGYNYQNGLKSDDELTDGANKRKVKNMPDYLTYMGYVFYVPACLVGPVFQYRDFQDYINQRGDYEQMPSTIKPALYELRTFIISLAIYLGTSSFNLWHTVEPQFSNYTFLYKLFYIGGVIFHISYKYITAWGLGMVSVHSSGLSYSKQTNTFDKIQVTKALGFYFNPSLKIKAQCWNISVQVALKRYIYEQVYDQKKEYKSQKEKKKLQGKAQLYTVLSSAYWHGLYPGYFVSFFHWMIYLRMNQELFRLRKMSQYVDNLWAKYKFGYVENIITNYVVLYFGIFFHIMTWENIKSIVVSTYGIPFIILYSLYFIIYQAEMLTRSRKLRQDRAKKAD